MKLLAALALLAGCGSSDDSGNATVNVALPSKKMSGDDLKAVEKAVALPVKLLVKERLCGLRWHPLIV